MLVDKQVFLTRISQRQNPHTTLPNSKQKAAWSKQRIKTKFHIAIVIHQSSREKDCVQSTEKTDLRDRVAELRADNAVLAPNRSGRHLGHKFLLICCQKVWQRPSNSPVGHMLLLRLPSLYPDTLISFARPLPFSY